MLGKTTSKNTTNSKNYFTRGGSCSENWCTRQICETIYLHRYPESENLVVRQK